MGSQRWPLLPSYPFLRDLSPAKHRCILLPRHAALACPSKCVCVCACAHPSRWPGLPVAIFPPTDMPPYHMAHDGCQIHPYHRYPPTLSGPSPLMKCSLITHPPTTHNTPQDHFHQNNTQPVNDHPPHPMHPIPSMHHTNG